jgi:hypothetical protein
MMTAQQYGGDHGEPRTEASQLCLGGAQASPVDPSLSKTAPRVSQKDLVVLCWTTVSVSA